MNIVATKSNVYSILLRSIMMPFLWLGNNQASSHHSLSTINPLQQILCSNMETTLETGGVSRTVCWNLRINNAFVRSTYL